MVVYGQSLEESSRSEARAKTPKWESLFCTSSQEAFRAEFQSHPLLFHPPSPNF